MKIHHLKQIIDQICNEIFCPHCQKACQCPNMEMVRVGKSGAEFQFICPNCNIESKVQAQLEHNKKKPVPANDALFRIPIKETEEEAKIRYKKMNEIKEIGSEVKRFEGGDVRELFL